MYKMKIKERREEDGDKKTRLFLFAISLIYWINTRALGLVWYCGATCYSTNIYMVYYMHYYCASTVLLRSISQCHTRLGF